MKNTLFLASLICVSALSACGGGGSAKEARVDNRDNTCGIPNFNAEMMAQINAKRAAGAVCGADVMPSAKALAWNQNLQWAATRHAYDMLGMNKLTHDGSDGSNSLTRQLDAGYSNPAGSENAVGPGGDNTVRSMIDAWMGSAPHCKIMLSFNYKDVGVSCAGGYAAMELS
jgi:uncharacterized protein YkwD